MQFKIAAQCAHVFLFPPCHGSWQLPADNSVALWSVVVRLSSIKTTKQQCYCCQFINLLSSLLLSAVVSVQNKRNPSPPHPPAVHHIHCLGPAHQSQPHHIQISSHSLHPITSTSFEAPTENIIDIAMGPNRQRPLLSSDVHIVINIHLFKKWRLSWLKYYILCDTWLHLWTVV